MEERYQTEVIVQISKVYDDGHNHYSQSGERLSFQQAFNFQASDFTQVSHILGQFQGLAARMKDEREKTGN